jgi:hypothetical protein
VKRIVLLAGALIAFVCISAFPVFAQEKKEHPKEHPASKKTVSVDQIDKAIRGHVEKAAKDSGGRFAVKDDVLSKTWELELIGVHKDRLQALADGSYFACVDFKANDGTMIDVDFFLKKQGEDLVVTDTSVHKVNGKARYNYEEKDGVWRRVSENKTK